MTVLTDAPMELQVSIREFWPADEWDNAASVAKLESDFDAFALQNSVDESHPCGAYLRELRGQRIVAERSVGYFQINSCNFPDWEWQRLYNGRHNCGTAHMLWSSAGSWRPWYFSALQLGLL
jgi:hypothetical protein